MVVKQTLVADGPPLVMANSSRLARALNHLSNPSYQDNPMTVNVNGESGQVHSGVELIDLLIATDLYTPVIYDGRMFVNFVGISVKYGKDIIPVKVPTWIGTSIDPANPSVDDNSYGDKLVREVKGSTLIVPVNHSEHVMVLFKKGTSEPAMLIRWYMGLPGVEVAQGTIFKAAIFQRPSWSSYRIVNTYQTITAVHQFINGGSKIMQLFNFIQNKYKYPKNGYAVLAVCQDTTGIMEGILKGGGNKVTIWPLSREPLLDFYYESIASSIGLKLHSINGGTLILDIPTDSHPELYPRITDREVELERIGLNIPTRNIQELHFPVVKDDLLEMSEKSATFHSALVK